MATVDSSGSFLPRTVPYPSHVPRNPPDPAAEARRSPDGRSGGWSERVGLAARSADGALEVTVWWTVADVDGRGAIDVRVSRPGHRLVAVVDDDLPAAIAGRFELRAPALWADLVVETPLVHVTFGLEAFGLALDDGVGVTADARGERVPVGLDLDFETDAARPPVPEPRDAGSDADGGYELVCHAHGEVLIAEARLDLEGTGRRSHSWGAPVDARNTSTGF